jgi:mono/diheme cytochrome c family protein/DNA-binding beta-propeller fold protein YncE
MPFPEAGDLGNFFPQIEIGQMKQSPPTEFFILACLIAGVLTGTAQATELKRVSIEEPTFRRPVAIQRLDENTAVVANQSGTLSVVDLMKWAVVSEFRIGGSPSDLAVSNGRLLVTDSDRSRLLVLQLDRESARVVSEVAVPESPVTVRSSRDGTSCSVASLWARTLTIVSLPEESKTQATIVASVDLPFAPREQIRNDASSQIIVADSFSGRLAVVSTESRKIEAVHEFGAHNIRGLALNPETGRLLVSHQILNHRAVPRRSDIIWGVMIDNTIREATLEKVLSGNPKAMEGNRFISVGYAGQGAGDPDSMFVDGEGRTIIALSGVGEVSVVEADGNGFRRVAVGRRPVAVMPISDGRFVVVNQLSNSLSLVDLTISPGDVKSQPQKSQSQKNTETADNEKRYADDDYSSGSYGSTYLDTDVYVSHLELGATPKDGPAQRGEALFFDARLSHANWFSCHSCHTDGHTNGGMADTFGDESTGAPKRILSLLGVRETGPWGWNGKKQTLLAQVHQSGESTMKGQDGISKAAANDLVAYLDTLERPPRFRKATTPDETSLVTQGRGLFESLNCAACHRSYTLTSDDVYDVSLVDERGLRKFNPPSLRGVGHRYRLFHDNRAANVEDVVTRFRHKLSRELPPEEQQALIRYLKSL